MFLPFRVLGRGFSFSFRSPGSIPEGAGRAAAGAAGPAPLCRDAPRPLPRTPSPPAAAGGSGIPLEKEVTQEPKVLCRPLPVPPALRTFPLLVMAAVPCPWAAQLAPAGAGTGALPSQLRGGEHPLGASLGFMDVPKRICFFAKLPVRPLAYISTVLHA